MAIDVCPGPIQPIKQISDYFPRYPRGLPPTLPHVGPLRSALSTSSASASTTAAAESDRPNEDNPDRALAGASASLQATKKDEEPDVEGYDSDDSSEWWFPHLSPCHCLPRCFLTFLRVCVCIPFSSFSLPFSYYCISIFATGCQASLQPCGFVALSVTFLFSQLPRPSLSISSRLAYVRMLTLCLSVDRQPTVAAAKNTAPPPSPPLQLSSNWKDVWCYWSEWLQSLCVHFPLPSVYRVPNLYCRSVSPDCVFSAPWWSLKLVAVLSSVGCICKAHPHFILTSGKTATKFLSCDCIVHSLVCFVLVSKAWRYVRVCACMYVCVCLHISLHHRGEAPFEKAFCRMSFLLI